jgi:Putative adhesin
METTTRDEIEERFEVDSGAELSISAVSGRISIRGGDDRVITVRADKHGPTGAKSNTNVEISHEGNRVTVHTRGIQPGLLNFGRNMASVNYDITVPRDCEVRAKAVSAGIDIHGTRARVSLQTVSGEVVLDDQGAECSVTTVSGDISGRRLASSLTVHTTSGDAQITESRLSSFNLHSVSGDFIIDTPLTRGEHYLVKTVSGDLHIRVPDGTGATVQMRSISGDVVCELPAEVIKSGRRHWQGRINGGGANLEMNSVSGDLRISRGTGAATQETSGPPRTDAPSNDAAPPDLAPDESAPGETPAGAILGALERGEITVEQAMSRLEDLQ